MTFHSYFWIGSKLEPADEQALAQFQDTKNPVHELHDALATLLDSDSVPAQCIALDQYSYLQGQGRFGPVDWLDPLESRMRACMLLQLDAPPYVRTEPGADPHIGANHASGFFAMWHLANEGDGPRVTKALARNSDPQVLELGVKAAEIMLDGEELLDEELSSVLHGLWRDGSQSSTVRAGALIALGVCANERVVPWLMNGLEEDDLTVSAAAARTLLERDLERFREYVVPIVGRWNAPENPPYDVIEVDRLLDGVDQ